MGALYRKTMSNITRNVIVVGAILMAGLYFGNDVERIEPSTPSERQATVVTIPDDCWIGDAPKDVTMPGHVYATKNGRTAKYGPRVTGQALEQLFDGQDHGLNVHAFCR